jgi:hypothetical protein
VYAKGLRRKEGAPEKKIHKKEKKGTDMVEWNLWMLWIAK